MLIARMGRAVSDKPETCNYCPRILPRNEPFPFQETDSVADDSDDFDLIPICWACKKLIVDQCKKFDIEVHDDPVLYKSSASEFEYRKDF